MEQRGWLRLIAVTWPDGYAEMARSRWTRNRALTVVLMGCAAAAGAAVGLVIGYAAGTPKRTGAELGALVGTLVVCAWLLVVGARAMWVWWFGERRTFSTRRIPLRASVVETQSDAVSDDS